MQKKRVSNENTREKTAALNPNLREAMYADEDDYNEVKNCDRIRHPFILTVLTALGHRERRI